MAEYVCSELSQHSPPSSQTTLSDVIPIMVGNGTLPVGAPKQGNDSCCSVLSLAFDKNDHFHHAFFIPHRYRSSTANRPLYFNHHLKSNLTAPSNSSNNQPFFIITPDLKVVILTNAPLLTALLGGETPCSSSHYYNQTLHNQSSRNTSLRLMKLDDGSAILVSHPDLSPNSTSLTALQNLLSHQFIAIKSEPCSNPPCPNNSPDKTKPTRPSVKPRYSHHSDAKSVQNNSEITPLSTPSSLPSDTCTQPPCINRRKGYYFTASALIPSVLLTATERHRFPFKIQRFSPSKNKSPPSDTDHAYVHAIYVIKTPAVVLLKHPSNRVINRESASQGYRYRIGITRYFYCTLWYCYEYMKEGNKLYYGCNENECYPIDKHYQPHANELMTEQDILNKLLRGLQTQICRSETFIYSFVEQRLYRCMMTDHVPKKGKLLLHYSQR